MLRVKIFSSDTRTNEISVIETEIDHWLQSEQPTIRQVIQSSSAGQVVLTFLYDDTRRDLSAHDSSIASHDTLAQGPDRDADDAIEDEPDSLPDAELPY